MVLLELLKDKENDLCHDHIFKCLHILIERQDEANFITESEKDMTKSQTLLKRVKPETMEIIINYLISRKLRFNNKSDQANEIFQALTSVCQESNNFELFSINLFEKFAVTMNKDLEMILNELFAYKQEIGIDKITVIDKKNDHENV